MTSITFIPHAHSIDEERGLASGHSDIDLSAQGVCEAKDLQDQLAGQTFSAAFCSDLNRAYHTAQIALAHKHIPLKQDRRLRGVDFGRYTHKLRTETRQVSQQHIHTPFPDGESHNDVIRRYREFLSEIKQQYPGQNVLIFAQSVYPLEVILNHRPIEEVLFNKAKPYKHFTA